MLLWVMNARKIIFEDEDDAFMLSYKEATGVSIQAFVTKAVKEYKLKLETEQAIKDLPFNQK